LTISTARLPFPSSADSICGQLLPLNYSPVFAPLIPAQRQGVSFLGRFYLYLTVCASSCSRGADLRFMTQHQTIKHRPAFYSTASNYKTQTSIPFGTGWMSSFRYKDSYSVERKKIRPIAYGPDLRYINAVAIARGRCPLRGFLRGIPGCVHSGDWRRSVQGYPVR